LLAATAIEIASSIATSGPIIAPVLEPIPATHPRPAPLVACRPAEAEPIRRHPWQAPPPHARAPRGDPGSLRARPSHALTGAAGRLRAWPPAHIVSLGCAPLGRGSGPRAWSSRALIFERERC